MYLLERVQGYFSVVALKWPNSDVGANFIRKRFWVLEDLA